MVVLALSIGKTFEVATNKVELFEKNCKKHNGKQIVLERLSIGTFILVTCIRDKSTISFL